MYLYECHHLVVHQSHYIMYIILAVQHVTFWLRQTAKRCTSAVRYRQTVINWAENVRSCLQPGFEPGAFCIGSPEPYQWGTGVVLIGIDWHYWGFSIVMYKETKWLYTKVKINNSVVSFSSFIMTYVWSEALRCFRWLKIFTEYVIWETYYDWCISNSTIN